MKTIHTAKSQKSILKLFVLPVLLLIAVVTLSFHSAEEFPVQTQNETRYEIPSQECTIQEMAISNTESYLGGNNYQSPSADKLIVYTEDIGGQSNPRVPVSYPKLGSNGIVDIGGNGNVGSTPKPLPYNIHNASKADETSYQEFMVGEHGLF